MSAIAVSAMARVVSRIATQGAAPKAVSKKGAASGSLTGVSGGSARTKRGGAGDELLG